MRLRYFIDNLVCVRVYVCVCAFAIPIRDLFPLEMGLVVTEIKS
jgi:hypothetical protein